MAQQYQARTPQFLVRTPQVTQPAPQVNTQQQSQSQRNYQTINQQPRTVQPVPQQQAQQVKSPLTTTFVPRSSILQERKNNPSGKNKVQPSLTEQQAKQMLGISNFNPTPVNPGAANVTQGSNQQFNTNVPLANIIHQGGQALDNTKNQAMVMSGQAGLPPAITNQNLFLDNLVNGSFDVMNGDVTPRNEVKPAVIIKDGQEVQLPNNYISHNGRIYNYSNGQWQEVQDLNSIDYSNYDLNPTTYAPPRYDFAGNPLSSTGEVLTTPGLDPGNPITGSVYAGNPYSIEDFTAPSGNNISVADLVSTGNLAIDPVKKALMSIQNLGFNSNQILSNPAMLEIILKSAGIV